MTPDAPVIFMLGGLFAIIVCMVLNVPSGDIPMQPVPPVRKRPVAWRVKDFADGWILFDNEEAAYNEAERTGARIQGLYTRGCD